MFPKVISQQEVDVVIDEFMKNFYLLDESRFKEGSDGPACGKKYSNDGLGMAPEAIQFLSTLAQQIKEGQFKPSEESLLNLIDLFVIYSNHLDQQQKDTLYPKLPEEKKRSLVLLFLDAATHLITPLLPEPSAFKDASPRLLSTWAQYEFYYNKAVRYRNTPDEVRLEGAQLAVNIATHLKSQPLTKKQDPHDFTARLETFKSLVFYCLVALGRYDKAIEVRQSGTQSFDATARAHAFVQISEVLLIKNQKFGDSIEPALECTTKAMGIALPTNQLMRYNIRVAHMNVLFAAGHSEDAKDLATSILDEMNKDPNCGAKPHHREAASKVIAEVAAREEALAAESQSTSFKP